MPGAPPNGSAGLPVEVRKCGSAQAAEVPLVEEADDEDDVEEEEEAEDFESDPVDADDVEDDEESDEAEPEAFAEDEAGVLLDEEPRLSFR